MLHRPLLEHHRPANFRGLLLALFAIVLSTACTDRMSSSDDRWSAGGELIAMSGGEGGARYACVTCHGARGEGNGFDAPRLAGLPAGYLQKQMEDYARGLRPHEVMRDAARFLDSHERVRVANHYAALPPQAFAFAARHRRSHRRERPRRCMPVPVSSAMASKASAPCTGRR